MIMAKALNQKACPEPKKKKKEIWQRMHVNGNKIGKCV